MPDFRFRRRLRSFSGNVRRFVDVIPVGDDQISGPVVGGRRTGQDGAVIASGVLEAAAQCRTIERRDAERTEDEDPLQPDGRPAASP